MMISSEKEGKFGAISQKRSLEYFHPLPGLQVLVAEEKYRYKRKTEAGK